MHPPQSIVTLRHRADWQPLVWVLGLFALRMAQWAWGNAHAWWMVGIWAVLVFSLACVKHNHVHQPVFVQALPNRLYEFLLNIMTGTSTVGMVVIHVINHHTTANDAHDWGATAPFRKGRHGYNLLLYTFRVPFVFVKEKREYMRTAAKPHLQQRERQEIYAIWAFLLLLLALAPLPTLVYWVLPNFLGQFVLVGMNYLQHEGCEVGSAYNHSRNFVGKVINRFTFNAGYHTIHHLQPNLHWSRLPAAHQTLIEPYIRPDLDQPDMLLFVWRWAMLSA